MLDHLELKTPSLEACLEFYARVLAPLGYALKVDEKAKGFGDGVGLDFFLVAGEAASDAHYAFKCPDRRAVDRCFALGERSTGRQDRPPALAPHHPNYSPATSATPTGGSWSSSVTSRNSAGGRPGPRLGFIHHPYHMLWVSVGKSAKLCGLRPDDGWTSVRFAANPSRVVRSNRQASK